MDYKLQIALTVLAYAMSGMFVSIALATLVGTIDNIREMIKFW